MEPSTEPNNTPALPSATVVLLRDGAPGLEVFLLRRHGLSEVLGGAYVFPGGKVDREDAEWIDRLDTDIAPLHAALGEPDLRVEEAATLYVAAVREAFEETGLLLAHIDPEEARSAWAALRAGPRFGELFEGRGLRLAASALHPWSRWITPVVGGVLRKRFDTRFFVAEVPPGQEPRHDDHEATASVWLQPRAALAQYLAREIDLAPPQIMTLSHLARHTNVASAVAETQSRRPPCIRTEPVLEDGRRCLCYPGDPAHSEAVRAMPGPTRLCWNEGRFEPVGGLEALLDG